MTVWIVAGCALWFAQVFFAASFKTVLAADPATALQDHVRGKDAAPEPSILGGRAARAQANLAESLPVFFVLGVLLEIQGAPTLGVQGAIVFLAGRALFVPAYLSALPGLRTLMWTVGATGLLMMAAALLGA